MNEPSSYPEAPCLYGWGGCCWNSSTASQQLRYWTLQSLSWRLSLYIASWRRSLRPALMQRLPTTSGGDFLEQIACDSLQRKTGERGVDSLSSEETPVTATGTKLDCRFQRKSRPKHKLDCAQNSNLRSATIFTSLSIFLFPNSHSASSNNLKTKPAFFQQLGELTKKHVYWTKYSNSNAAKTL